MKARLPPPIRSRAGFAVKKVFGHGTPCPYEIPLCPPLSERGSISVYIGVHRWLIEVFVFVFLRDLRVLRG